MLDVLAVKPEEIEGYNDISDTQFFTAVQIAAGKVDVGLCTANVAKENGLVLFHWQKRFITLPPPMQSF